MEERKVLVAGGNLLQAHTWKGMLETCGITVELRGEALMGGVGELPVDMQTVELWVAESQLEQAQTQLALLDAEQPQWQCLQCHECNEASFELCWNCGAERSESHH
ncbi:putative signal transducing protein [Shewanella sp. YIC-542]|uniref:putative signal transducing protein n=1 Tax=Shewanella mytili TaxID=3377111 RepID=UPI00398EDDAE